MGKDSASSAQSKQAGGSVRREGTGLEDGGTGDRGRDTVVTNVSSVEPETARLRPCWGELGYTGRYGGAGGKRGVSLGTDGVVSDVVGVSDRVGGGTARFGGIWGELGGWNRLWGCSDGSGSEFCRSRAAARGPEWGRAGDLAVVGKRVDDVAVVLGVSG
jgi:hypothetical protein